MTDVVNSPSHYTSGDIECIDAIEASMSKKEFVGFLKGNAIKYLWRYDKKKKPIEDLQKSVFYINKMIEVKSNEENK
jgi:hypothetical protein